MNKGSLMFKMLCVAMCLSLCLAVLPAFAEDVLDENAEVIETAEESAEEPTAVPTEEETEEQVVLDLYDAAFRDGGIYITPGEENDTVFTNTFDKLRYRVLAGSPNIIKLNGFEDDMTIDSSAISDKAKDVLQATGEVSAAAAHSGYFGLAVSAGEFKYRSAVSGGYIYAFSAWVKMPASGSISDDGRILKIVGESGKEYIVGYNEIGRDTALADGWQQIFFTFKAPESGLFTINFTYRGRVAMYMDDIELYETELFFNPLKITSTECTDSNGASYNYSSGFSTNGTLTHKTVLYNEGSDDVYFTAYTAVYRNDILISLTMSDECALVLDETEIETEIEIPTEGEVSEYKYMVYFVSDTDLTAYYGEVPSRINPYVVKGK